MTPENAKNDAGMDRRIGTGNADADLILGGGIPEHSITVVMGHPGTGKTIFAEQLLFHNARDDRPVLYLTTLSEPLNKVVRYVQRFDFYDETKLGGSVIYDDAGHDLMEKGVRSLVSRVKDSIKTLSPRLIVIDSFRAIHDLDESPSEMRRLITELAGLLSAYDVTAILVGEYAEEDIRRYPEFAVADGIIELARRRTGRRDERYLRVLKLRGSHYREGAHALRIDSSGMVVFPRLVTPPVPPEYQVPEERVTLGVDGLDALFDGGLWAGSNTLVAGRAGSGKTTLGLSFVAEGVRREQPSLYVNFQENPVQLARTIRSLGIDLAALRERGLHLYYSSPVELQIDSIVTDLFAIIRKQGIRRVVIDALGDLALAADDQERFHDYLYTLTQHFISNRITSLMTLEKVHGSNATTRGEALWISSIADGIIELDLELDGERPRRTLRIAKARGIKHDLRAHEMVIHRAGLRIAAPPA